MEVAACCRKSENDAEESTGEMCGLIGTLGVFIGNEYIETHNTTPESLDINKYSVHKLRHTAATLMYQQGGVDIRILKEVLGHENLGTTEIYTHLGNDSIKEAAEASPLAGMKLPSQRKKKVDSPID